MSIRAGVMALPPMFSADTLREDGRAAQKSSTGLPHVQVRRPGPASRDAWAVVACTRSISSSTTKLNGSRGRRMSRTLSTPVLCAPPPMQDSRRRCIGVGNDFGSSLDTVLFLDVDGVLHPSKAHIKHHLFQASAMALLRDVVLQETGAKIVLSTAWRLHADSRRLLKEKLHEYGLPLWVGQTPSLACRSTEILAWVQKHRPSRWVAVDDLPLLEETDEIAGHFVQTKPKLGLTAEAAHRIIELFRLQENACVRPASVSTI